jgi:hypothetical protein
MRPSSMRNGARARRDATMQCLLCSESDRGSAAAQYVAKGHFRTHASQQIASSSMTSSALMSKGRLGWTSNCSAGRCNVSDGDSPNSAR